jgi:hypothetical protein
MTTPTSLSPSPSPPLPSPKQKVTNFPASCYLDDDLAAARDMAAAAVALSGASSPGYGSSPAWSTGLPPRRPYGSALGVPLGRGASGGFAHAAESEEAEAGDSAGPVDEGMASGGEGSGQEGGSGGCPAGAAAAAAAARRGGVDEELADMADALLLLHESA